MTSYDKTFYLTKKLTILYIEDDTILLEETSEIFENLFLKVDTAINGEEGLKKYLSYFQTNSKHYDIVITDINMPKINGIDLIKKIYLTNENQPIIVISAHNESKYLLELVNLGIEQFLIKPNNYETTLDVLYNTANKISKISNKHSDSQEVVLNDNYIWSKKNSSLFYNNENVKLTKNETFLMQIFIKNENKISTLEEIFNAIWQDNPHLASTETLKSIISRLRKKIPNNIENVYGLGYRLIY